MILTLSIERVDTPMYTTNGQLDGRTNERQCLTPSISWDRDMLILTLVMYTALAYDDSILAVGVTCEIWLKEINVKSNHRF